MNYMVRIFLLNRKVYILYIAYRRYMEKSNKDSKKLKDIQFNFLMDVKTKTALDEIVKFSELSASAVLRRLISKENKERTLEI